MFFSLTVSKLRKRLGSSGTGSHFPQRAESKDGDGRGGGGRGPAGTNEDKHVLMADVTPEGSRRQSVENM